MMELLRIRLKSSNWLSAIFKHSKWYLLASLATKAMGFLLLPLYTQYLTPTDYGILTSLEVINYLLPFFFSFALVSAFDRFYHQKTGNSRYLSTLFSTILFFVLAAGTAVVTLVIISSYFWMPHFLEVPAYPYALLGFLPTLLTEISLLGFAFFRQSLQAKKVSLILISSALVNIVISLWLVVGQEMGVLGRLWGNLGASVLSFVAVLWYAHKNQLIKFVVDRPLLRNCLRYSVPLIPLAASSWINVFSDRLIIGQYVGIDAVGIYSIAFHISMILYFVGESIVQVLVPMIMSGLEKREISIKNKLSDYNYYLWSLLLFGSLVACFFAQPIINYFLDPAFGETAAIIPILCLAITFQMSHRLYGQLINYHKRTRIFMVGALISAGLNILLNLLLVPKYGYLAAAYTTLGVSIFYAVFVVGWSRQLEAVGLPHWKYLVGAALVLVLVIFPKIIPNNFISGIGLLSIFSGIIFYTVYHQSLDSFKTARRIATVDEA
ncbi:MAG: oligosaccharide flippase family protein [Bacteroidota bacterium]